MKTYKSHQTAVQSSQLSSCKALCWVSLPPIFWSGTSQGAILLWLAPLATATDGDLDKQQIPWTECNGKFGKAGPLKVNWIWEPHMFGQGGLSNNSLVQEVMIVWYNRGHYTYNCKALEISGKSKQIHCRWLSTPLIWRKHQQHHIAIPTKIQKQLLVLIRSYKHVINIKLMRVQDTKCPFLQHQHPNWKRTALLLSPRGC